MNSILRRTAAPAIAAGLLIAMIATNAAGTLGTPPGVDEYFQRVSTTITGVPLQAGPWLGMDIDVIPAAQELLQPNKILQRRYTNAEDPRHEWFELLIVHCGDVRDMLGHFPPVCYPANGWKLDHRIGVDVPLGETPVPATRYGFSREIDFVREEIRIVNLFVLPAVEGDAFGPDFGIVERAGRYRERARLGAAQVQIIVPSTLNAEDRTRIVEVAMKLVGPVLFDVERGPM